jgi:hypothetical protein
MGFHLNNGKKYFPASFLPLFVIFCHFTASIFSGQGQFFGASVELFGRKFSHLATVIGLIKEKKLLHNIDNAKH